MILVLKLGKYVVAKLITKPVLKSTGFFYAPIFLRIHPNSLFQIKIILKRQAPIYFSQNSAFLHYANRRSN